MSKTGISAETDSILVVAGGWGKAKWGLTTNG